jgi:ABC-type bacteriocin/lantibiotic exporter with double-glycine peptidase domain
MAFIPFLIFIAFIVSIPIRKLQRRVMASQGEVADRFVDTFVGINELKLFSAERYFITRIKNKIYDYVTTNFSLNLIRNISINVSGFVLSLLTIAILWIGATFVSQGTLSLGSMMLFFSLVAYVISPIQRFPTVLFLILDALVAIERVQGIKDLPVENKVFVGSDTLTDVKGKIEFRNVTFGYRKDESILKNISFAIQPGEICAIVGETGVGKTTLVKLLSGFYKVDSGQIFIDEKPIDCISLNSLRENISAVPQRSHLFRESLFRNIVMS